MKRVFGNELLENASSAIQELLAREERKIKMRMEKKKSKMSQKYSILGSFFDSSHKLPRNLVRKKSVNPIITILFVGMALKTWKRFAQRKINGELLPSDSLPVLDEDESYEVSESPKEDSLSSIPSSSNDDDSSSFNTNLRSRYRRNAERNEEEDEDENEGLDRSRSASGSEIEDHESQSSGSSMKSVEVERIRDAELKKGRRMDRFSQIDLIKGFLWNKLEGNKDATRSTNMFVNYLSIHSNLSRKGPKNLSILKRNGGFMDE